MNIANLENFAIMAQGIKEIMARNESKAEQRTVVRYNYLLNVSRLSRRLCS